MLHSGRLLPYPQTMDEAGKDCHLDYYENLYITEIFGFLVLAENKFKNK